MFAIEMVTLAFVAAVVVAAAVEGLARDWHATRAQIVLRDDHAEATFAAWVRGEGPFARVDWPCER